MMFSEFTLAVPAQSWTTIMLLEIRDLMACIRCVRRLGTK